MVGCGAVQSKARWEPMVTEAKAMFECEGDCLAVIQALSSKKTGQTEFFLVLDDIRM